MIDLAADVYLRLKAINWFTEAGRSPLPDYDFPVTSIESKDAALSSFSSDRWFDLKTLAQGDLTGYLAKNHPDSYDDWNNLVTRSRPLVQECISERLVPAIENSGLGEDKIPAILFELNLAVVEVGYRRRFRRTPIFFERLLRIYETGRLPCGWQKISKWPMGQVVIY